VRRSLVSLLFLVGKILVPSISGEKESCFPCSWWARSLFPLFLVRKSLVFYCS
jgi:hypothetical protein